MAVKRLLTEFGMGASLRRQDYTQAAVRGVKDALWHNSINLAELFGKAKKDMLIDVEVAVQNPCFSGCQRVAEIFPYGQVQVTVVPGGLGCAAARWAAHGDGKCRDFCFLRFEGGLMSDQRFIIEMGMGNDQYGQDYTKAAGRAIEDAFRHSAIPMFQALEPALGLTPQEMRVQVTIGVQDPAQVDTAALVSTLPRGRAEVRAVFGGQNVTNPDTGNVIVIASAAIEAFLPYQGDRT